jgi:hypothetical protein
MSNKVNTKPQDAQDDFDSVPVNDQHADVSTGYPFIQWITGQPALKRLHPVLGTGGFGMPVEQFVAASAEGVIPDFFTSGPIQHRSGNETDAYLTNGLSVAVLAYRFGWTIRTPGGQQQLSAEYVKGARGKLQVLVLVKGFDTLGPVMLTFRGEGSRRFYDLLKAFRQSVIAQAGALRKQKDRGFKGFPLYAFWMPVKAGARVEVGQPGATSWVTPPVAAWDGEGLKDTAKRTDILRGLFVGKDVLAKADALYDEAQTWAKAWKDTIAAGNRPDTEANGDEPPAPDDDSPTPDEEIPY